MLLLILLIVNANAMAKFEIDMYNRQRDEFCSNDNFKHLCSEDMIKLSENYSKIVQSKIQKIITQRKEHKKQKLIWNTLRKHFLDRHF